MEQDSLCISWNSLPWKKFHRKSSSLQRKIYESKQNEDRRSLKRLQKLLLRSKSLYYIAVKKVTDYYSVKGIFLSEKTKSGLVNEIYMKFSREKNSLVGVKRIVNFIILRSLKDEVAAYIWNYVIEPASSLITIQHQSYFYHTKTCITFKRIFTISFLHSIYFEFLKSLLTVTARYKFPIFRSWTSIIPNFYFRRCPLNFRLDLPSLYVSTVLLRIENLELLRFLNELDSNQENASTCVDKNSSYLVQRGLKSANILLRYKRFLRISGLISL
jgi:hypothetical protein